MPTVRTAEAADTTTGTAIAAEPAAAARRIVPIVNVMNTVIATAAENVFPK